MKSGTVKVSNKIYRQAEDYPARSLRNMMQEGTLPNPYELQSTDVHKYIDQDFGLVAPTDVGRKIYLRDDIIQMESVDQAEARRHQGAPVDLGYPDEWDEYYEEEGFTEEDEELEEDFTPEEDDAYMKPSGQLGSRISLSVEGKFLGEFSDEEEAKAFLAEWAEDNNFWPNLWYVDDHSGTNGPVEYMVVSDAGPGRQEGATYRKGEGPTAPLSNAIKREIESGMKEMKFDEANVGTPVIGSGMAGFMGDRSRDPFPRDMLGILTGYRVWAYAGRGYEYEVEREDGKFVWIAGQDFYKVEDEAPEAVPEPVPEKDQMEMFAGGSTYRDPEDGSEPTVGEWMAEAVHFNTEKYEGNVVQLAQDAVDALGLQIDLDDNSHPIWDLAAYFAKVDDDDYYEDPQASGMEIGPGENVAPGWTLGSTKTTTAAPPWMDDEDDLPSEEYELPEEEFELPSEEEGLPQEPMLPLEEEDLPEEDANFPFDVSILDENVLEALDAESGTGEDIHLTVDYESVLADSIPDIDKAERLVNDASVVTSVGGRYYLEREGKEISITFEASEEESSSLFSEFVLEDADLDFRR